VLFESLLEESEFHSINMNLKRVCAIG
jgi:hypothetical protein